MTFSYLINRTVKGLNKEFYLHHFWCICFAPLFILYFSWWDGTSFLSFKDEITQKSLYQSFVAVVLLVLYPYARFAYLSILEYTGLYTIANFLTAVTIGIFNLVSMVLCYSFGLFIAPIGFLCIFLIIRSREKKQEKEAQLQQFNQDIPPLPTVEEELAKWSALYREGKISKEEYFRIADSLNFKDKQGF